MRHLFFQVSVMAMQDGFTLTGYQTQAGNVLEMITLSEKSAYVSIFACSRQIWDFVSEYSVLKV